MDGIRPAQLSFLTIYNPLLGKGEDNDHEQIVYFYSSRHGRARMERQARGLSAEELQNEERNERMRQIGLAQGMVNFARDFSDGAPVDFIDTEKSRIFMHELEPQWWILASIDLTEIEVTVPNDPSKPAPDKPQKRTDYSTRELCPQPLLLQHVLRAHGVFLLHHGASLSDVFSRRGRPVLAAALERFWNRFVRYWDVLMHASPATDIFSGLKLAVGGELGIGVGEEEWGSGERAVLEDLVHETEGLVDLVVSRFGNAPSEKVERYEEEADPWMGVGAYPAASDGVIFAGVGAITRLDVVRISAWMETIYRFGTAAYGVQDSPMRSKRRRKERPEGPSRAETLESKATTSIPTTPSVVGIPPPILTHQGPSSTAGNKNGKDIKADHGNKVEKTESQGYVDGETLMKYMTLGIYGSSWGIPSGRPVPARTPSNASKKNKDSSQDKADDDNDDNEQQEPLESLEPVSLEEQARRRARRYPDVTRGCFIVGLKADLESIRDAEDNDVEEEEAAAAAAAAAAAREEVITPDSASAESARPTDPASRIQVRTVYMNRGASINLSSPRLRVLVYVRRPFVYTFLFDANSQPGLSMRSFYRRLHVQLAPLHRSLLRSTSPSGVRRRLKEAARRDARMDVAVPASSSSSHSAAAAPVYDVMYDHERGTCHTSLPAVPDFGESISLVAARARAASGASDASRGAAATPWSRADAVHVHSLIARIWQDTRRRPKEVERTVCSSRGWWVVWMRLFADAESERSAVVTEEGEEGGTTEEEEEDERKPVVERTAGGEFASSATSAKDTLSITDLPGSEFASSRATSIAPSEEGDSEAHDRPGDDPADVSSTVSSSEHYETSKVAKQSVNLLKEAFLVRRAQDNAGRSSKGLLSSFTSSGKKQDNTSSGNAIKLSEGMGVDPRRYVESLMSLNR